MRPPHSITTEVDGGHPPVGVARRPTPDRTLPAAQRGVLISLLEALRPHQWVKNVLVLAAPAAAGLLTESGALVRTALAFGVFSCAASGTYLLNDVCDVEQDRRHPVKRLRPVASGRLPLALAGTTAAGLLLVSLLVALAASAQLSLVVGLYVALTVAYSFGLKDMAIIDLAVVAAGFVLRAVAGGVATGVDISGWFLIVACFGALFMVTGKRQAESAGPEAAGTRQVLADYSPQFLRYMRYTASTVAIVAYCLWAFQGAASGGGIWTELSIVPFVLAIFRYALLLEAGQGEDPTALVLADRPLQALGLAWVLMFLLGVYAL